MHYKTSRLFVVWIYWYSWTSFVETSWNFRLDRVLQLTEDTLIEMQNKTNILSLMSVRIETDGKGCVNREVTKMLK